MISIIIPALDEAEHLPRLFADLRAGDAAAEVIVVDGGSTDGTRRLAREAGASVIRAERGRGRQIAAVVQECECVELRDAFPGRKWRCVRGKDI